MSAGRPCPVPEVRVLSPTSKNLRGTADRHIFEPKKMLNRPIPPNSITLCLSAVICFMVFCVTGALAQNDNDIDEPFGLSTVAAPETVLAATWENLLQEINSDLSIIARCRIEPQSCSSPAAVKLLPSQKKANNTNPWLRLATSIELQILQ